MENTLNISYLFTFGHDKVKEFTVRLNRKNLALVREREDAPPAWAALDSHRCDNCPLDAAKTRHCPVALNMAGIVSEFADFFSYETVHVNVTTQERTYSKATTLQEGLSSLIGIIMVTSGCPVMEKLKPMVRFHLPFASIEETVFRMVSMYLVAQYFRKMEGRLADWDLEGLKKIYDDVGRVNMSFAARLKDAAVNDANVNALVNLDVFAKMVPLTAEEMLAEIREYFAAY